MPPSHRSTSYYSPAPQWCVYDGSVPGLQPFEMEIDAFCPVIDYRHYRFKNLGAYINPDADL